MDGVVEYCCVDTNALEYMHTFILENKYIIRTTATQRKTRWVPFLMPLESAGFEMRSVYDCIKHVLAMPVNTSWMDNPPDPAKPYKWAINILSE